MQVTSCESAELCIFHVATNGSQAAVQTLQIEHPVYITSSVGTCCVWDVHLQGPYLLSKSWDTECPS